ISLEGKTKPRRLARLTIVSMRSLRRAIRTPSGWRSAGSAPQLNGRARPTSLLPVNSPVDPVRVDVQCVPAHPAPVRALVLLDPPRPPPPARQQVRQPPHVLLVVPQAEPHRVRLGDLVPVHPVRPAEVLGPRRG